MDGFIGNYEHSLDPKNRVFIPAKFREKLNDVVVVRVKPGKFRHIECFLEDEFSRCVEDELSKAVTDYQRNTLTYGARGISSPVSIDSQGRISLNSSILRTSEIEKNVLFIGMGNRFEIWNPDVFYAMFDGISDNYEQEEAASRKEDEKRRKFKAEGRFIELKN